MSYPPPHGGYSPYGGPPPSHSPQPGYQQPPPGQYPPQGYPPQGYPPQGYPPQPVHQQPPAGQYPPPGHSPYPQQQGYGAPPLQQPGYGHPPPQQQGYGAPQSGQYPPQGYPPQQGVYGQPQGYPPQPQGQYPPPQQPYGVPMQQPQHGQPQGQYGAPPPHYGATMPTPPSPGYGPITVPITDASFPADALRKAMKGFGTDEATLIRILCHYPAEQIPNLKSTYQQRHHRSLEADVASETSSYFELALLSILRGPLQQDVFLLNKALKGIGTNESLLNDVVIGRSNADLRAIKQAYQATYRRSLESDVSSDLSAKTERLFSMVLAATRQEESAPIIPQAVEADVSELHRATEGKMGTDQLTVCSILSNRSDSHIRAIAHAYEARYRASLEKVIRAEFSGHMCEALVRMVRSVTDRAMRDAVLLEDCMAGPGTKDEMLVARVVGMHWNRDHMGQVKGAYRTKYGKDLVHRIKGETSGDYEKVLIAMVS